MDLLLPFAVKSLIIAGVTLAVLAIARSRSAAERSWIAHFGLVALLLMPLAGVVLPALQVEAPAFMAPDAAPIEPAVIPLVPAVEAAPPLATMAAGKDSSAIDLWPLLYGIPALILLGITLLALLRLFALRSRAEVLVEPTWLSALAHAQRRMGFKNGTALLTSSDLHSPISWGLFRPVILLNREALAAGEQAEAIIAHELAHVARFDWAKLMLARVATALFWFNPLVWMLAREAHQLREETADDAVLAANIPDTDYAELLIGVARHECNGMLLGAHGVAPGKGSLSRRVSRVLDAGLPRGPVAGSFAGGVAIGAVLFAAPLAALTFAPAIEQAPAAVPAPVTTPTEPQPSLPAATEAAAVAVANATGAVRSSAAASRAAAVGAGEAARAATRASAPMNPTSDDDAAGRWAVGATPAYARELATAGYRNLTSEQLIEARVLGVTAAYAQAMRIPGHPPLTIEQLGQLRAVGASPRDVAALRRAGTGPVTVDKLLTVRTVRDIPGGRGNSVMTSHGARNVAIRSATGARVVVRDHGEVEIVSPIRPPVRPRIERHPPHFDDHYEPPELPEPPDPPEVHHPED